jgi:hypothetical protein
MYEMRCDFSLVPQLANYRNLCCRPKRVKNDEAQTRDASRRIQSSFPPLHSYPGIDFSLLCVPASLREKVLSLAPWKRQENTFIAQRRRGAEIWRRKNNGIRIVAHQTMWISMCRPEEKTTLSSPGTPWTLHHLLAKPFLGLHTNWAVAALGRIARLSISLEHDSPCAMRCADL